MNTTTKELKVLSDIANSEYQDGADPVGHGIWLDYVIDSQSRGGVLTSLVKKGLVKIVMVPMSESWNRSNGISDSTVEMTAAGMAALETKRTARNSERRARHQAMRDLGLVRVRGNLGGSYWE